MDSLEPRPDERPAPKRTTAFQALLLGLLGCGLVALLSLGGLLDWPKSEPAARRILVLRAAELESWLRQELLVPIERLAFAEPGGPADAAASWRTVLRALEAHALRGPRESGLPPFTDGSPVATAVRAAIGARRFTPFAAVDELVASEWLRGARLFASLIDRAPAHAPIEPWLDAALVLASDLRSIALLAPALGAAELEEAVERRLAGDAPVGDVHVLRSIASHAIRAAGSIPAPERIAERESRLAQASACMRARVPPFDGGDEDALRLDPPWPLVMTAATVDRLEGYDERLREVLAPSASAKARAAYERWVAAYVRELPAAATLVAEPALLAPIQEAPARLARVRAAAERRLETEPAAMQVR